MHLLIFIATLLLTTVFVISGLGKLTDAQRTQRALIDFRLPVRLAVPTGWALPVAELVVAIALLPTGSRWWGALGAIALLLLITAGIGVNLANGRRPVCHCFGQLDSRPIGWQMLVRNGLLAGMAGLILSQGWVKTQLQGASISKTLAFNVQSGSGAAIGLILVGAAVGEGWFIYRLQRRLASLEHKLATKGFAFAGGSGSLAAGLAVGSRAPDFRLTGLDGDTIRLDHLRSAGKPVLLVFTDTECDPCTQLLPTLAYWQREHAANLTIANIGRGPLEANRAKSVAHGVKNVFVPTGGEVAQAYRAFAAPSAVLIRSDGTIGSTVVLGEGAIGALIQVTLSSSQPFALSA